MAKQTILGTDLGRDAFKVKTNANFTELYEKDAALEQLINTFAAHLSEQTVYLTTAVRDISLEGEQIIALLNGRTAKKITIYANLNVTESLSVGMATPLSQTCILQRENGTTANFNGAIRIYSSSGNYISGTLTIENGQIKIAWTKTGTPTGTIYMILMADYHD